MSVRLPFFNRNYDKFQNNFIGLIKNTICPNFELMSITSLLLGICLFVFIIMHILYPPGGYGTFLQLPTQMNTWALDIHTFINNKAKFYTLLTALFIHYSYIQLIFTLIFGIFIMYELEYCWRMGIIASLVAGFAANCLAVVLTSGIVMGFTEVICASIGVMLAALILHCSYLKATYPGQLYMVFMMIIILLFFNIGMGSSGLTNLFGVLFGLLFGLALYPTMRQAPQNPNVEKLFKVFSVSFLALAILLAFTA